jgi:membrane protease YdiL (CAAX protease family)
VSDEPLNEPVLHEVVVDSVIAAPPPLPEQPEFPSFYYEPVPRPVERTPNFGDAIIFLLFMGIGLVAVTCLMGLALHFHWGGIRSFDDVKNKTWMTIGSQGLLYVIGLAAAVPFFRTMWRKPYFAGIHWNGDTAGRLGLRLLGVAVLCNVVAMAGNYVLPFPDHAPIDKLFSTQADAWMVLVFGVFVAPFFEEMIFRGFLLPAMATAWDWSNEKINKTQPRALDGSGQPVWSVGAMVFGAMVVSVPFALMHAEQVANSWGPLAVLYCVSLTLCAVRLLTRSLAASTLVHSVYNSLLFVVMLVDTGGFRHLDKL